MDSMPDRGCAPDHAEDVVLEEQWISSYEKLLDKLRDWFDAAVTSLPNLAVALLAFAVAYGLARLARRMIKRHLTGVSDPALRALLASVTSGVVITLGFLVALNVMNLDTVLRSMLAGAGVAGVAIGLAVQSSLSNTFAGMFLTLRKVVNVGDWVESNGFAGTVHQLTLRNTVLRASDNNLIVIPNKTVVENPFKNFSLTDRVRVTVACGVAYDSDLDHVEQVTKEAVAERFPQLDEEHVELHFLEFGSSSVDLQVRFWTDARVSRAILEARSEAIKLVHATFEREGIEIPFPQRVVRTSWDDAASTPSQRS
jgi:small conductance mechanosensitive channel